jgi:hypothetical protein
MEDGRMAVSEPGANGSHILPLSPPVAAMPMQAGAPDWNGIAPPIGQAGPPGSTNEFDFPALPTARVPAPPMGQANGNGAYAGDMALEATSRVSADAASADAPPNAPPDGFVVKGGTADWQARSQDLADGVGAFGAPIAMPPLGDMPPIPGMAPAPRDPHDERPFSATSLGLPRLTSANLGEIPVSWRELASGAVSVPEQGYGQSASDDVPDRWPNEPGWRRSGPLDDGSQPGAGGHDRWGNSDGWGDSQADSREYAGANGYSESMPAYTGSESVPDLFASSSLLALDDPPFGKVRRGPPSSGSRFEVDDDEGLPDDPFADPSAWARASEAGYRKGHTRIGRAVHYRQPRMRRGPPKARSLFTLLLLFVLVDSALILVLRPDLCPDNRCVPIHGLIVHYVPALDLTHAQPPTITTNPQKVTIQVAVGASAKATVVLKNAASAKSEWKASTDVKWVSIAPATGTVPAAGSATLTITASPPAGTKPGSYTANATISVGTTTLKVPVTITVGAGK